ncbi:unnamed protein product, partial [Iphiclides podalirius]
MVPFSPIHLRNPKTLHCTSRLGLRVVTCRDGCAAARKPSCHSSDAEMTMISLPVASSLPISSTTDRLVESELVPAAKSISVRSHKGGRTNQESLQGPSLFKPHIDKYLSEYTAPNKRTNMNKQSRGARTVVEGGFLARSDMYARSIVTPVHNIVHPRRPLHRH